MLRFSIILILGIALFTSCKDTPSRPEAILDEGYVPSVVTTSAASSNPNISATPSSPTAEPPQNAEGVWHYTCTAGCAGGSGSAIPCSSCGQTLVHNTTYHNNNGGTPAATATNTGGITSPVMGLGTTPEAAKAPEPPQNAAGVWHYTCDAGCAGGAGSATACAGCGNTLVHNTAYH